MDVYLEVGKKKTFAGALDWPGWSRSGRDEVRALDALLEAGSRYAKILHSSNLEFDLPQGIERFNVVERLEGSAGTEFGVPAAVPAADLRTLQDKELERWQALLKTFGLAFIDTAKSVEGKELRKGPRGGGRDLVKIMSHVLEANAG